MNTAFCVLFAIFAQIVAPQPPVDVQAKARAQILLREGTGLFDRGDHAGALEKFQSAYGIFPSPKILFNIGEADRALARNVDALEALQRFLSEAPDAPVESRTEARRTVADLTAKLGRIAVDCRTVGAEITVDGRRVGAAPLPKPVWATPGHHQIAARHPEFLPAIEDVEVTAGSIRTLTLDLRPPAKQLRLAAPLPVPAPVPVRGAVVEMPSSTEGTTSSATNETPITHRWWFWTAIGAAAIAGTAGIIAASSGGGTDVPKTTLGAQSAF